MKYVYTAILAAGILLVFGSAARADNSADACLKKANTTLDMTDCSTAWIKREDDALAAAWRRALVAAGGSKAATGAALLAEQRAWITFKTKVCEAFYDRAQYGTLGSSVTAPARTARLTAARTAYLAAIAKALTDTPTN
jgi:uncharacterized protein YecT (DUF1311 family)